MNVIIESSEFKKKNENPFQGREKLFHFPVMVLYYPDKTGITYPAWYGELTPANVASLQNSPARNEISTHILSGVTAVFLFLESGNSETDQKYFHILQTELERLTKILKIPITGVDINGNPIAVADYQDVPLNFTIVRVSRQDPSEEVFVSMLLGTEFDLRNYQTPLVFPIFGQGRSLYALVGAGIKGNTIEKACQSLVDWCSCEIKALHQGVDLLFWVDWSKRSGGTWVPLETLPPLTGLSNFMTQKAQTVSTHEHKNQSATRTKTDEDSINTEDCQEVEIDSGIVAQSINSSHDSLSIYRHTLLLLLILFVAVLLVTFFIKSKTKTLE